MGPGPAAPGEAEASTGDLREPGGHCVGGSRLQADLRQKVLLAQQRQRSVFIARAGFVKQELTRAEPLRKSSGTTQGHCSASSRTHRIHPCI